MSLATVRHGVARMYSIVRDSTTCAKTASNFVAVRKMCEPQAAFAERTLRAFLINILMIRVLAICMLLTGCVTVDPTDTAETYIGLSEYGNRSQLTNLVGVDPIHTEWCAAFVNAVLDLSGLPNNRDHEHPLTARSFLDWGYPVEKHQVVRGDIVIFPRGNSKWEGHVGFYVETVAGRWIILGGNQDNTVSYASYKPSQVIGVRRAFPPNATVPQAMIDP